VCSLPYGSALLRLDLYLQKIREMLENSYGAGAAMG